MLVQMLFGDEFIIMVERLDVLDDDEHMVLETCRGMK